MNTYALLVTLLLFASSLLLGKVVGWLWLQRWKVSVRDRSRSPKPPSEDPPARPVPDAMTERELAYWSARFRRLDVRELAGCTFEKYLRRPRYYERCVEARRELARRRDQLHLN